MVRHLYNAHAVNSQTPFFPLYTTVHPYYKGLGSCYVISVQKVLSEFVNTTHSYSVILQGSTCILQVETYGSMERREKVDFILEQMRLCLAKKDYIRTQIISKKISPKFFENNQEQVCAQSSSLFVFLQECKSPLPCYSCVHLFYEQKSSCS